MPRQEVTDIDEQLSAYLDGELSRQQRRRLEALLSEDAALRQRLQQLRRLDELLDGVSHPRLRRDLTPAVLSRIRRRKGRRSICSRDAFSWRLWPASVAAVLVFGAMLGLSWFGSDRPEAPLARPTGLVGSRPVVPSSSVSVQRLPHPQRLEFAYADASEQLCSQQLLEQLDVLMDWSVLEACEDAMALDSVLGTVPPPYY